MGVFSALFGRFRASTTEKVQLVNATREIGLMTTNEQRELFGLPPVEREVWADVRSISRAEFAAAGAAGLKPSLMAVVHACDYGGQTRLRWEGLTLEVYRTYRRGNVVELYATEKRGKADG